MRRVQGNKVKPNPKRKYFFTEEQIAEAYKKHDGNYDAMARELLPANIVSPGKQLYSSIKNQTWAHKYYPKGTKRKYFFTEDQIAESYKKHDGNYSAMGRELFPAGTEKPGNILFGSIQNQPWAHKYPPTGTPGKKSKYLFTEDQIAESYKKHDGNYKEMGKELLSDVLENPGLLLRQAIKNEPWASKYLPKGSARKYFLTEGEFAAAYKRFDGNYSAMGKALLPAGTEKSGNILYASIKNQPWAHKYPRRKKEALGDKKRLNRGQYQNAVTNALASKIGMEVPQVYRDDEEINKDAEMLLKDINDLSNEGMSVDEIAEELNIEKAIVRRALEVRVKPNPKRKYFFTEEQFAAAYKKHDGNYSSMGKELLPDGTDQPGPSLYNSIKHKPWAHKYPSKGSKRKYFFTEEQLAAAYKKHDGNYSSMGKELLPDGTDQPGSRLFNSIKNQPWSHKYPPKGSVRKYFITEEQIADSHKKHKGNYAAMGRELLPASTKHPGARLYEAIENEPWAHKYPLRKHKAIGDMKEQSEEYDDYSFSESFDMPLFKKRKNPIKRSNPEPQFLRAYVNSIAEALWIYCFDFYEAVKLKRPISSVNNSAYLNFYYFVAVMNTDLAYFTMFYTCKMLSNIDFELSLLNNDMRPFNMNIIKALANKSEMESPFATKISIKIIDLMDYDSLESDERERVSDYFKQQIKNEMLHDIFVYFVMITTVKDVTPMVNEARNLIKEIFTNYEITVNKKEDVSKHTEDIILLLGCFRYLFAVDKMKFSINKKLSEKTRLDLARTFGGHINVFVAKNIIDSVIYFQNSLDKEINEMLPPVKPNPSKKHRRYQ